MKKSDIERKLKNELRQATPNGFDKVWKQCEQDSINEAKEYAFALERVAVGVENDGHRVNGKRLWTVLCALFTALALAIVGVCGMLLGWFEKDGDVGNGNGIKPFSKGFFLIDVNPSVEVDYDEDGNVSEVIGLNADGKVLLYGLEEELVGKSYEKAVEELFNRCVLLGYFSATSETNAVLVSAIKQTGETDETMTENVRSLFSKKFVDKKMCGVAVAGKQDSALEEEAQKYGINAQKWGMIQEYLALVEKLGVESEIPETEYGKVSIREIYEAMEELEEMKLGDKASDDLEEVLQGLEDMLEGKISPFALEEIEELLEELEDAKTLESLTAVAQPLVQFLDALEREIRGEDVEIVRSAKREIERLLLGVETDKDKMQQSTEDKFHEREEKHKDDFHKEANEPDGGFEHWQNENKGHFEDDWNGKKEHWKDSFDD